MNILLKQPYLDQFVFHGLQTEKTLPKYVHLFKHLDNTNPCAFDAGGSTIFKPSRSANKTYVRIWESGVDNAWSSLWETTFEKLMEINSNHFIFYKKLFWSLYSILICPVVEKNCWHRHVLRQRRFVSAKILICTLCYVNSKFLFKNMSLVFWCLGLFFRQNQGNK